jgi:hypothetical protein
MHTLHNPVLYLHFCQYENKGNPPEFSEIKLRPSSTHSMQDLHCTPCRIPQDEKQLKLILLFSQTSYIHHEIKSIHTHIALEKMHNREYKQNCKHTIQTDVNSNQDDTMKLSQRFYILTQIFLYMGSSLFFCAPTLYILHN